ncbi:MAG: serine/threonine protein kinase [Deltaproteobacteria bacterium]|nr:serine/threonine protein kinase [Deltaproteobacteria bacterium]
MDAGSRYRVITRLAGGGMAEVYLAVLQGAEGFEKTTIVKRMRPELAREGHFRRMFIDEARLMTSLSHRHVVSVLDFGEIDGSYYIALEYVDGVDLGRVLRHCPRLPPPVAGYICSCVLQALAYVHGRCGRDGAPLHIVHRDISPGNVFLGRNGDVKIGDFGVAKGVGSTEHTIPGTIKGKLAYMSPEQARGWPVDARSDLFAVGVVLYEAMLGRRPFRATSDMELWRAVVEADVPDPLQLDPSLPPALAGWLRKALARDPKERFESASEMEQELLRSMDGGIAGPADVVRLVEEAASALESGPIKEIGKGVTPKDPFALALAERAGSPEQPSTVSERSPSQDALLQPEGGGPRPRRRVRWAMAGVGALLAGSFAGYLGLVSGPPGGADPLAVQDAMTMPVADASIPDASGRSAWETGLDPSAVADGGSEAASDASLAEPLLPLTLDSAFAGRRKPKGRAWLDVNSTPWAKVYLDGTYRGDTPLLGLQVEAGPHQVRLTNPATKREVLMRIELSPGERRVIPVDLAEEHTR